MYFNHAFRKGFLPLTVTGTTLSTATLGTTTGLVLPVSSATGIVTGQSVSGTGIQAGTVVVGISSTNITISKPINAYIASGTTITFGGGTATPTTSAALNAPNVLQFAATTGVTIGMSVSGTSIPTGTTVTAVTSTLVTLSNSVTATVATTASIAFGNSVPTLTSGSTASLTAGQIGFFSADGITAQAASARPFIIAQGSYFLNDKIGPVHGGYKESVKSKVINPKYITRVMKINAVSPVNQIKQVCVGSLECGKTYRLRLDLKGSPALRFLSHNIYKTLDAFTGCCTDDCSATCTGAIVDPTIAVIKWAKQIVESPILNQMVKLTVYAWDESPVAVQAGTSQAQIATFEAALDAYSSSFDPTTDASSVACLNIEVAYVETKFGNCTFTPTDHYELQPLLVFPSLTDETGDACNVQNVAITETQVPRQGSGLGETVLRDMILDGRYRQEAYPDSMRVESLRMREIEANPGLAAIDRNAYYDQVQILHSVPRFNNPTGTFDNDQYLLVFHVPTGTNTSSLTNYILAAASAAGNNDLALETYV